MEKAIDECRRTTILTSAVKYDTDSTRVDEQLCQWTGVELWRLGIVPAAHPGPHGIFPGHVENPGAKLHVAVNSLLLPLFSCLYQFCCAL